MFRITSHPINTESLRRQLESISAGGLVVFEGRVRNQNDGRRVQSLLYECFEPLALKEGDRILDEVLHKHAIEKAVCVHRVGHLHIGDIAIWVGVQAAHRHPAFAACEAIVESVKARVPIWKQEFYEDDSSQWIHMTVRPVDPLPLSS